MKRKRAVLVVVATFLVAMATACVPPPGPTSPPPGATGPSSGCGTTTRGPVVESYELVDVNGAGRTYAITIPPNHQPRTTQPIPLVFDFHGFIEGSVRTHPFATQFSAEANREGFAVAFPIGQADGLAWDVRLTEDNSDLQFVDALLSKLESTLCIDRSRVYITGLSFGGFMTSMLMCMRSNTFAAAAPVAGMLDMCTTPERKIPFVTFHGNDDPILPWDWFQGTAAVVAGRYGCVDPTEETVVAKDPGTNGPITKTTWDCTAAHSAAEFYVIGNGGHSWPGSEFFSRIGPIVGPTATSLDATDVIWKFFEAKHL